MPSRPRADILLDALHPLTLGDTPTAPEVANAIAADLCQAAPALTTTALARRARQTVQDHDRDAAKKRRIKARTDRKVTLDPAPDTMAWISALLPAEDAVTVMTTLTQLAETRAPGDDRTLDQRRADAFTDVFTRILDTGQTPCPGRHDTAADPGSAAGTLPTRPEDADDDTEGPSPVEPIAGTGPHPTGELCAACGGCTAAPLPTRHGRRPHLQVVANLTTLLGLDDAPAHLGGYGPVPAALARELAARASWQPLLVDDHGRLLAAGTYRIPRHLRDFAAAREITCTFPGCRMPADRCDLDHVDPYDPRRPAQDQTTGDNLRHLCRHHHRLKTSRRWTVHLDPDTGDSLWTTPTGRTHRRPLEPPLGRGVPPGSDPRANDRDDSPPPEAQPPPPF